MPSEREELAKLLFECDRWIWDTATESERAPYLARADRLLPYIQQRVAEGKLEAATEAMRISGEAVDAAVMAERERCAKIAEYEPRVWDANAPDPQHRIAAAIRSGEGK